MPRHRRLDSRLGFWNWCESWHDNETIPRLYGFTIFFRSNGRALRYDRFKKLITKGVVLVVPWTFNFIIRKTALLSESQPDALILLLTSQTFSVLCFARISETRRGEREEKISNLNFFALSTFSSLKLQLAITLIKIILHYPTHDTFISIVVRIQQCHQL